jgi:hypothetical protein
LSCRGTAECYLIFVLEFTTVVHEQVENQVHKNLRPLVPTLLVADASLFVIGVVLLAFMVGTLPLSSWSVH